MQRRAAGQRLGAVLFTDIVGSTAIAAEMGNSRWSELVDGGGARRARALDDRTSGWIAVVYGSNVPSVIYLRA